MGMYGFLCTVSPKRRMHLEEEPGLVHELAASRREGNVPGLLNLEKTWDALDVLLSDRGKDDELGDVILARHGRPIGAIGAYGPARMLTAERVRAVAMALSRLPEDFVKTRWKMLAPAKPHGDYGDDEDEIAELAAALEKVKALYLKAAKDGHGVLAMVV